MKKITIVVSILSICIFFAVYFSRYPENESYLSAANINYSIDSNLDSSAVLLTKLLNGISDIELRKIIDQLPKNELDPLIVAKGSANISYSIRNMTFDFDSNSNFTNLSFEDYFREPKLNGAEIPLPVISSFLEGSGGVEDFSGFTILWKTLVIVLIIVFILNWIMYFIKKDNVLLWNAVFTGLTILLINICYLILNANVIIYDTSNAMMNALQQIPQNEYLRILARISQNNSIVFDISVLVGALIVISFYIYQRKGKEV